ncbi:MAG TPA: spermidine synthase [Thermoleophilia bacterium]|nr:spermidine synthase [Thermoleophilia bacterium]
MPTEVLDRVEGRSGELVLRRRSGHLEVILNGAFLISTENEASSRAMVTAGLEAVALPVPDPGSQAATGSGAASAEGHSLDVLIGGLGLGYALDEALASPRVGRVTVVEYEPTVVRWFEEHGAERAARAAADRARAAIVVADVADVLRDRPGAFDLVCLDTDNGPGWLVREANAGLYDEAGVRLAHEALRRGGAAVFWSTQRYPEFEARLRAAFGGVRAAGAHDVVAGRRHEYVMYVARRVD